MFYHIIIEKVTKNSKEKKTPIYVYNLDKSTLINNYVTPYKIGKPFIADGYCNLSQENISRFKIVSTEQDIDAIVKIEIEKLRRAGVLVIGHDRNDVVNSNKLTNDVTQIIFNELSLSKDFSKNVQKFNNSRRNSIFIVHGHQTDKVTEVENFIRSIGCDPIVLFKEADAGDTIIEKIERYSEISTYAIVIYTKCDVGYSFEKPDCKKPRARQNVVFEHGYLMAKLGRERVCAILEDKSIEVPSDISGIIYKEFDSSGKWKYNVANEMKNIGIKVDLGKIR